MAKEGDAEGEGGRRPARGARETREARGAKASVKAQGQSKQEVVVYIFVQIFLQE